MIVGLAGHVDHGKTSLIRALTGVDTDRLPEERARGMTIDLGFAYTALPDGRVLGFVDVPGHERFLSNMLAGVLGMDRVLLVVAADDGPMPQTREHLEVLRLVGVPALAVAVTKTDRVDGARAAAVATEMAALVARAGHPDAPVHRASSVTGEGLAELRAWLAAPTSPPADRGEGFRLPIDRSFVLPGVGPVVTGTVAAGRVAVGDTLLLAPSRLAARVRSLRVQDRPAEAAGPGDRCALALAGARVERARLRRGDWLVAPDLWAPTATLDVALRLADGRALRSPVGVQIHHGAAAVAARLRVWDETADGFRARVQLARPLPALAADRLVLRDDATGRILAGGHVIDPFPPSRRRPRAERLVQLAALARPGQRDMLGAVLATDGWADLAMLARARNRAPAELEAAIAGLPASLIGREGRRVAVADALRAALRERLLAALADYHAGHPDLPGPGRAALLAALGRPDQHGIAEAVLADLVAAQAIHATGLALHLPDHVPRLAPPDAARWPRVAELLASDGMRPPRVRELAEALALDPEAMEALLVRYERFGRLLRVAGNRFFLPATVAALGREAARLAVEADGFTAAEFNRRTGIGRNLAIEVLEFLDRLGVTRRVGELRHVVRDVAELVG